MKCKKTIDARKFPHDALEALRRSAVERVEAGESPEDVAEGLGINRRTIYRWLEAYHYGGADALKAKPIPGRPPKLTARQMQRLSRIIRDKNPLQLSFNFALWTLPMIRELIRREYGVSLSEVSVGRLMRRLGFTPQRPLYKAIQQNPVLVEKWRNEEFPKIARKAKQEGALIFFGDESGIRSDYHAGTTWAPKGRTPVVKATGKRFSLNMLSAVNAQGHFRFMTVERSVTSGVFCEFLERLIEGVDCKIHLIVDNHSSHNAKKVAQFVKDHADQIELHFLPPYSPELNPDELAWAHVKGTLAKKFVQTVEDLKKEAQSVLHKLQKLPKIVAAFFRMPSCSYATL